ncbi:hypothetical protein [Bacillus sp. FSL K6-6540]|uniref:hypothetical protein n=1 Tax=Bacillus sp. FSL K6-6540 TaxID=2921512 RepID=UPI0030F65ACA
MLQDIKIAIKRQEKVYIRLINGEALQGIPESLSNRVKIRQKQGVTWIPVTEIEHVSRLVALHKKDPASE